MTSAQEDVPPVLTDMQVGILYSSNVDTVTLAELLGVAHDAFLHRYQAVLASAVERATADLQKAILDLAARQISETEFLLLASASGAAPSPNSRKEHLPIVLHFDALDALV